MSPSNSRIWSVPELQTFLAIVGDGLIQRELNGAVRNERVFKKVSQRMAALGFYRTTDQCRVKLKKLKVQYKKIKNNNSGDGGSTWRWFDAMDAIYGHRLVNGCGDREMDATGLLESMVNPVDTGEGVDNDAFPDEGPSISLKTSSSPDMKSSPTHLEISAPRHYPIGEEVDNDALPPSFPEEGPSTSLKCSSSPVMKSLKRGQQTQHDRRRVHQDVRTVLEEMQAADERQLERLEKLSERQFQMLYEDAQAARRQEAELARQQMEQWATFHQAFLGVLGQLVQVLGCSRDPMMSPPSQ